MIQEAISRQIASLLGSPVRRVSSESGGSINAAYRIELADSRPYFLKTNDGSLYAMFEAEARGLSLLREACRGIRVPEVKGHDKTDDGSLSWLLLEYIENSRPGSLYQSNTPHKTWASFYSHERLMPQMKAAIDSGLLQPGLARNFDNLFARLGEIFPDEPPALLHGDLWGGNYLCDRDGTPVIIDPAVYFGHREMEIAFTKLFGGYDRAFYTSYNEAWPLCKGHEQRVDICNLYPLLVHTNLFGSSYAGRVASIIKNF
ncbi:MAG: fructosamine kinase family protein [Rhodothermaceae bacterium]|nr:fructosamine kinase family protein [Rhodothermaceae bacterium]